MRWSEHLSVDGRGIFPRMARTVGQAVLAPDVVSDESCCFADCAEILGKERNATGLFCQLFKGLPGAPLSLFSS